MYLYYLQLVIDVASPLLLAADEFICDYTLSVQCNNMVSVGFCRNSHCEFGDTCQHAKLLSLPSCILLFLKILALGTMTTLKV